MIRNLKHALPLSLVIALSLANPLDDFPMFTQIPARDRRESTFPPQKIGTQAAPLYSSPLSIAMRIRDVNQKPAVRSNPSTNSTRPIANATNAKKFPRAQASLCRHPFSRPALRQVAGPGSQYRRLRTPRPGSLRVKRGTLRFTQLDALYREKGLDAPPDEL